MALNPSIQPVSIIKPWRYKCRLLTLDKTNQQHNRVYTQKIVVCLLVMISTKTLNFTTMDFTILYSITSPDYTAMALKSSLFPSTIFFGTAWFHLNAMALQVRDYGMAVCNEK